MAAGYWLLAAGGWLAADCWMLLAAGCWPLARKAQESPGEPRRAQESPGQLEEPRRTQESPGEPSEPREPRQPRRAWGSPGDARRAQESPGAARRAQESHLRCQMCRFVELSFILGFLPVPAYPKLETHPGKPRVPSLGFRVFMF